MSDEKKYVRYAIVSEIVITGDLKCIGSNFYDLNKAVGEAYLYLCREIEELGSNWLLFKICKMMKLSEERGYVIRLENETHEVVRKCYILAEWYENKSVHDY